MTEQYLLICSFGTLDLYFDLVDRWVVKKGSTEEAISPLGNRAMLMCLPLLEIEFATFKAKLMAGIEQRIERSTEAFSTFPVQQLVSVALFSESVYWIDLALSWAVIIDIDDKSISHLLILSTNTLYPQAIRHKAKRIYFSKHTN